MNREVRKGMALLVLGLVSGGSIAGAQTVSRDTKITGPKGRSIERKIDVTRTPGHIERDVKITRPGGTYERDMRIDRAPGRPPGHGPGRPGGIIERDVIIERDYVVGPPPPPRGGAFFNFVLGSPPPPPVVFVPEPIYVQPVPPPNVVVQPPVRYAPPAQPETVLVDPVAQAIDRLQSHHGNSRRDGALTLGRLGDPRGVLPLSERLNKDWDKDVRVAAAWALGEIGDPRAGLALQKAALYDKKDDVKNVANKAIAKLNRPIDDPNVQIVPPSGSVSPTTSGTALPLPSTEPPFSGQRSLDPPAPPSPEPPSDFPK